MLAIRARPRHTPTPQKKLPWHGPQHPHTPHHAYLEHDHALKGKLEADRGGLKDARPVKGGPEEETHHHNQRHLGDQRAGTTWQSNARAFESMLSDTKKKQLQPKKKSRQDPFLMSSSPGAVGGQPQVAKPCRNQARRNKPATPARDAEKKPTNHKHLKKKAYHCPWAAPRPCA